MKSALQEQRKTYVTVEEAALRCNRSERTIRRWIQKELVQVNRDTLGFVRVDLSDLERVCAGRADTVHPVRNEIARLASYDETLEQRIDSLLQEMAHLKQRVALLESQDQAGGGESPRRKSSSPRIGGAEGRGLPTGTLRLVPYAEQHEVVVSQIKSLFYEHEIDLVRYQREGEPVRNKTEWWITPEQQLQLIRYWQEHHIPYTPCGACQGCVEQAQSDEID